MIPSTLVVYRHKKPFYKKPWDDYSMKNNLFNTIYFVLPIILCCTKIVIKKGTQDVVSYAKVIFHVRNIISL